MTQLVGSDLWGRVNEISDRLTIECEGIRGEEWIQELDQRKWVWNWDGKCHWWSRFGKDVQKFLGANIQFECHVEVVNRCEVGCMYLKFRGEDAIPMGDINLEVVMWIKSYYLKL